MNEIPTSRVEEILQSKIDGTAYDRPPLSRVEALLMELDTGGGTSNDYNTLNNLPSINGVKIIGDLTSDDLDVERNYDASYDPDDETLIITQAEI